MSISKARIQKGDLIASVDLTVNIPAGLVVYAETLLESGLYGCTVEDVFHRLIVRSINRRIDDGRLPMYDFDRMGNVKSVRQLRRSRGVDHDR